MRSCIRIWSLFLLAGVDGYRILVFHPTQCKSHSIVPEHLFEELASRGHQLTLVTSYPHKTPVANLREIDLSHKLPPVVSNFSIQHIKTVMPNKFVNPFFLAECDIKCCEEAYPEPEILGLLNSNETFDLVITETFATECFVPFAHRFGAPLITFVTSSALPWVAQWSGLPDNPAYIPNYFVEFSTEMTLFERTYNTIILIYTKLFYHFYALPLAQSVVDKYFGDTVPPLVQLLRNTSLIFINSHFSLSFSRPFPPNIVEIGGIHIKPNSSQLPKDLQNMLDSSTQGVVLMSFGSLVRTSTIPPEVIREILNAFANIPQTVIFKYEDDLPVVPPNVIIRKWLPQQQIVEHNNVVLVITHGGLASIIEAAHFGKPIIGVPFYSDQFLNVKSMVRRGAGLMLNLNELTQPNVEDAIREILTNSSYSENAKRLSQHFRDRPMTPLQTAVYWTEYVIRHQGAPHLQPASVHLPLYQYLLLDVLAVLLLPLLTLFCLIYGFFSRKVHVKPKFPQKHKIN